MKNFNKELNLLLEKALKTTGKPVIPLKKRSSSAKGRALSQEIVKNQKKLVLFQEEYDKLAKRLLSVCEESYVINLQKKIENTKKNLEIEKKSNKTILLLQKKHGKNLNELENIGEIPEKLSKGYEISSQLSAFSSKNQRMNERNSAILSQIAEIEEKSNKIADKYEKALKLAEVYKLFICDKNREIYDISQGKVELMEKNIVILKKKNGKFVDNFKKNIVELKAIFKEKDDNLSMKEKEIMIQRGKIEELMMTEKINKDSLMKILPNTPKIAAFRGDFRENEEKYEEMEEKYEKYEKNEEKSNKNKEEIGGKSNKNKEEIGGKSNKNKEEIGGKSNKNKEEIVEKSNKITEEIGEKSNENKKEIVVNSNENKEEIGENSNENKVNSNENKEEIGEKSNENKEEIGVNSNENKEEINKTEEKSFNFNKKEEKKSFNFNKKKPEETPVILKPKSNEIAQNILQTPEKKGKKIDLFNESLEKNEFADIPEVKTIENPKENAINTVENAVITKENVIKAKKIIADPFAEKKVEGFDNEFFKENTTKPKKMRMGSGNAKKTQEVL